MTMAWGDNRVNGTAGGERLRFGIFLPPMHPVGQNPTRQ